MRLSFLDSVAAGEAKGFLAAPSDKLMPRAALAAMLGCMIADLPARLPPIPTSEGILDSRRRLEGVAERCMADACLAPETWIAIPGGAELAHRRSTRAEVEHTVSGGDLQHIARRDLSDESAKVMLALHVDTAGVAHLASARTTAPFERVTESVAASELTARILAIDPDYIVGYGINTRDLRTMYAAGKKNKANMVELGWSTSLGLSPRMNSSSWFFLSTASLPKRTVALPRSIMKKNLAVWSSRLEEARWPVEKTEIHMQSQTDRMAAQNMATAVVLPKRRGVHTRQSNCISAMPLLSRMTSRLGSNSSR